MSKVYWINLRSMLIREQLKYKFYALKVKYITEYQLEKNEAYNTCFFQPYRLIFPLFGIESQPSILDSRRKRIHSLQS